MRAQTVKKQILQTMVARGEPIRACNITASNQNVYLIQLERAGIISRKWHDGQGYKIAYFKDDEQRKKAIEWLKARGVKVA